MLEARKVLVTFGLAFWRPPARAKLGTFSVKKMCTDELCAFALLRRRITPRRWCKWRTKWSRQRSLSAKATRLGAARSTASLTSPSSSRLPTLPIGTSLRLLIRRLSTLRFIFLSWPQFLPCTCPTRIFSDSNHLVATPLITKTLFLHHIET